MTFYGVYLDPGTSFDYGQLQTSIYINDGLSIADSAIGTWSFWHRSIDAIDNSSSLDFLYGYDSTDADFFSNTVPDGDVVWESFLNHGTGYPNNGSGGPLMLRMQDNPTSPTATFKPYTGPVELDDGRWHHILCKWDTNHVAGSRIFTATIDRYTVVTWTEPEEDTGGAFSAPYSLVEGWTINDTNGSGHGGDIAEFWFFPGVSLDVTDPTIIDKFVDTSGNPVSLGADGSTPTGTAPPLYLSCQSGTPADFLTNLGSGGGTFTAYPGALHPLQLSTSNPTVEMPIRLVTQSGSTTDLTLHSTSFDPSLFSTFSNAAFFDEIGMPFVPTVSGYPVIPLQDPVFDNSSHDMVAASFIRLHDDGMTYDEAMIVSPGTGSTSAWLAAADSANVYVSYPTTVMQMAVMPINTSATATSVFPSMSSWMTTELGVTEPGQCANLIWWDGKVQCVGLIDSALAGGNAFMIDSAGDPTDTQIWGGYLTHYDSYKVGNNQNLALLSIPDPTDDQNYLLAFNVFAYEGNAAQFTIANTSGAETMTRTALHFDSAVAEAIINGYGDFNGDPTLPFGICVTANEHGYFFYGNRGTPLYKLVLNPACTSYTIQNLVAADSGGEMLFQGNALQGVYVSDAHTWLFGYTTTFFSDSDFQSPLQSNSTNYTKISGVDGDGTSDSWSLSSSGSSLYQLSPAPIDPDYMLATSIGPATEPGTPLPLPDGNEMFMIARANGSNNGYKAQIAWTGGQWVLTLLVMPSGSLTTIDMGDGSEFSTFSLYMVVQGTSISVGVLSTSTITEDTNWLASDGTFSIALTTSVPEPWNGIAIVPAISITDSTFTAAGNVLIGGTKP